MWRVHAWNGLSLVIFTAQKVLPADRSTESTISFRRRIITSASTSTVTARFDVAIKLVLQTIGQFKHLTAKGAKDGRVGLDDGKSFPWQLTNRTGALFDLVQNTPASTSLIVGLQNRKASFVRGQQAEFKGGTISPRVALRLATWMEGDCQARVTTIVLERLVCVSLRSLALGCHDGVRMIPKMIDDFGFDGCADYAGEKRRVPSPKPCLNAERHATYSPQ